MRLADWLKWQGYGARAKLARATGLTWESIDDIAQGKRAAPLLANALKIQDATGGEVTVAELAAKQSRKRVVSKRKRRRRTLAAAA